MADLPPSIPVTLIAQEAVPEEDRHDKPLPPTTTIQQDRTVAGQRRVNLIWEATQASIALLITGAFIYTAVRGVDSQTLTNALFLIVGFYFSRTNHTAIGGIGAKATDTQVYAGR